MGSPEPTLVLYIDYGTKHLCVAASLDYSDSAPLECRVLRLQGQHEHLPQVIGFDLTDAAAPRFAFGAHLEQELLSNREGRPFVVFERFKMHLFSCSQHGSTGSTRTPHNVLRQHLPTMSFDALIAVHLAAILEGALSSARQAFRTATQGLKVRTYFAVPEIATPNDTVRLGNILEQAGYQNATFISETEAAGAWYCYMLSQQAKAQDAYYGFEVCPRSLKEPMTTTANPCAVRR